MTYYFLNPVSAFSKIISPKYPICSFEDFRNLFPQYINHTHLMLNSDIVIKNNKIIKSLLGKFSKINPICLELLIHFYAKTGKIVFKE